jgi:chromosome segregation ATPase
MIHSRYDRLAVAESNAILKLGAENADVIIELISALVESENENLVTKSHLTLELDHTKTELKNDIRAVRDELQSSKTELKNDIKGVREELQSVKAELKSDVKEVREELNGVKAELKNDIKEVRVEIKEVRLEIKEVREEIKEVKKELKSDMSELSKKFTWILGLLFTLVALVIGSQLAIYQVLLNIANK